MRRFDLNIGHGHLCATNSMEILLELGSNESTCTKWKSRVQCRHDDRVRSTIPKKARIAARTRMARNLDRLILPPPPLFQGRILATDAPLLVGAKWRGVR